MTRKITLSIILILLIVCCYMVTFGKNEVINSKVPSISQLASASDELNKSVAMLETKTTTDYDKRKQTLSKNIEEYNKAKAEYDKLMPEELANNVLAENDIKDIYDVDFLWTIIGNYATEEGITLKFDVDRNTTSASSIKNDTGSSNYVVCDLQFTITGKYINLTQFIYDLEDDDRLNFEINNFHMIKSGEDLQVTLVVKEIKVNADNLLENSILNDNQENEGMDEENNTNTQNINSNTTNSTSKTNTTNTTNNVN